MDHHDNTSAGSSPRAIWINGLHFGCKARYDASRHGEARRMRTGAAKRGEARQARAEHLFHMY